ncbi:GNAT family N-acetyltransferase [Streptomyces marincola]|uniref:GNAT family N-acetyltransferase n=1 Tax=Streptomyces marincola TaxID=2878388 RepID=UPI001CF2B7A0|nr:GNAT family N-acetyltransferase [Streptomyces marincola]UCM88016.1 GNAT family N-acetyltransferase [Streptomyces marincola]
MGWRLQRYDGVSAETVADDLIDVYNRVYSVPPYRGDPFFSATAYAERLHDARAMPGFEAVTARQDDGTLVGYVHGVTLPTDRPWWTSLADRRPAALLAADQDIFWLRELMVLPDHTNRGLGRLLHHTINDSRREHHTTLTCIAGNEPAHSAYQRWGYTIMGPIRHHPTSPLYDAMYLSK